MYLLFTSKSFLLKCLNSINLFFIVTYPFPLPAAFLPLDEREPALRLPLPNGLPLLNMDPGLPIPGCLAAAAGLNPIGESE